MDNRWTRSFLHRVRRHWVNEASCPVLCDVRLVSGQKLRVDLRDWCGILFVSPNAIEPATTRFIRQALRPGDVFVDIGANVGYFTLLAGSRVKPGGRVLAVEPNPVVADLLEISLRQNQLTDIVTLVQQAVSNTSGQRLQLYLSNDQQNSGLSSLTPWVGHLESGALSASNVLDVETTTLVELVRIHRLSRLDVIKIDVEGAEEKVWEGAEEVIRQYRPRYIICESSLDGPVSQRARQLGYSVEMLEPVAQEGTWGNLLFRDSRCGLST